MAPRGLTTTPPLAWAPFLNGLVGIREASRIFYNMSQQRPWPLRLSPRDEAEWWARLGRRVEGGGRREEDGEEGCRGGGGGGRRRRIGRRSVLGSGMTGPNDPRALLLLTLIPLILLPVVFALHPRVPACLARPPSLAPVIILFLLILPSLLVGLARARLVAQFDDWRAIGTARLRGGLLARLLVRRRGDGFLLGLRINVLKGLRIQG